jgi:hypothetical protein
VEEINQEIEQAKNDMELLPEVNRSAVERRNRYKNELAVVESSVKKHKMRVDKLGMVVQQTHVSRIPSSFRPARNDYSTAVLLLGQIRRCFDGSGHCCFREIWCGSAT